MKLVPFKVGHAPLGVYLSYQLAPTEGNFEVRCNLDFSRGRSDNDESTNNLPEPLKHGIEHESAGLQQYTNYMKHNGRPVKTFTSGFIVHPSYPFLGCSPHGKVIDKTEDSPYWMLSPKEHALVIVSSILK